MLLLFLILFCSQLIIDSIRDLHLVEFHPVHDSQMSLKIGNLTFDLILLPYEMNPIIQLQYNNHSRTIPNTVKVFDVWVLSNSLQVGMGRLTQSNHVIEGRINLQEGTYVIYHTDSYRLLRKRDDVYPTFDGFVAYKEEDLVDLSGTPACNSHNLPFNQLKINSKLSKSHLPVFKRSFPQGCPQEQKVVYVGAATDCTYAAFLNNDQSLIIQQLISNFAAASSIYERSFNVGLGLFKVNIKMECDSDGWNQLCSDNYDITQRLSDFSAWRASSGGSDAGLWHLISTCPSGTTVGVAWLDQVCQTDLVTQNVNGQQQQISGAGVSSATSRDQYQVIAHEIGHNFGAIHDCTSNSCGSSGSNSCCPCSDQCDCKGQYIMNPTATIKSSDFSPCSIKDICTNLSNNGKCLLAPNSKPLLQGNVCGNGIKEDGEDCDCGDQCDTDKCCTKKCKFKDAAKCSDKNQQCCKDCQFKAKDTVCRNSINEECDIDEKCSGDNGDCPSDLHVNDGNSCAIDGQDAQCASGYCTSRDIQCKARGSNGSNLSGSCPDFKSSCQLMCCRISTAHVLY
eukprot:NODE_143_length_17796_cov_0.252020.p1 type:complete len:565 gc:universal NODE_143_length_17796_cov_0.252020:16790-15096(-)